MSFENKSEIGIGIYTVPDLAEILNLKYYKVQRLLNEYWDKRFAEQLGSKYSWTDGKSKAGKEKAIVITQDLRIQTTRHQRDLYQKFGLGVFFIKAPSKKGFSFWDMTTQLIKRWPEIKKLSSNTKRPFAYRCTSKQAHFEILD